MCVKESLEKEQEMPRCRIGHGLYSEDLNTESGKELFKVNERYRSCNRISINIKCKA